MKLHESPSPNARRVHLFLAEKGLPVPETVPVDIRGGENLGEAFRAKNPFGRVPVLELDDGTFLSESVAICRYFEALHPAPALFGADPLEQARVEMWNRRAEINFFLPAAQAFRNLTGFFADRERVCEEWGAISRAAAAEALETFDAVLARSEFLAGDRLTIADITLGVALEFAERVKLDLPFELANVVRYRHALAGRPSFQAA
jgi:glutathione S-transferase